MAGMEFSVTPQELIQKAEAMEQAIVSLKKDYADLKSLINRTSGYWIGEGGDSCRRMFMDRQEELEEMLERMRDHPEKLLNIAGVYRSGEEKIVQEHMRLPVDFLDG